MAFTISGFNSPEHMQAVQAQQDKWKDVKGINVPPEQAEAFQAAHPDMTIVNNAELGISVADPSSMSGRNFGGLSAWPTDFYNEWVNGNIQRTRQNQTEDNHSGFFGGLADAATEMRGGLSILAMPLMAAAGAGAFGAGAGAAEGAGTVGMDASTGLFAGESATSGAAGGAFGGTEGSASLIGGGSDTLSMPAAVPDDPFGLGGYTTDPNTGDVFYGTGDNPFATYPSGGGNPNAFYDGFNETTPGLMQQAKDLATQYGITPASALALAKQGIGLAGKAIPAALGAAGAKNQADSLNALAEKYMALGAPSRARYEESFAPGFTMENDPGYKGALDAAAKSSMHALSVNGNPAGSPNAWAKSLEDLYSKTAYPALQNFRNTNANAGGIASLQTAAPSAAAGAIQAQGDVFNAIGGGLNDIFNPKKSLAEQLMDLKKAGL